MTMDNCRNIMFANLWFYRVVRVTTPRDYGTLVSNCENIEFRNNRTWTQIICETAATVYDMNRNVSIYPLAFAYGKVSGNESSRRPEGRVGEAVKIGKGYSFASGATRDSKGNVYFCEGNLRKIYKWDAESEAITLLADYPYRPLSLADDFIEIYDNALPEESWLAPDGVTIIPRLFDFCRSVDLTLVTPGQWKSAERTMSSFS